jgi:hypothetical protein
MSKPSVTEQMSSPRGAYKVYSTGLELKEDPMRRQYENLQAEKKCTCKEAELDYAGGRPSTGSLIYMRY